MLASVDPRLAELAPAESCNITSGLLRYVRVRERESQEVMRHPPAGPEAHAHVLVPGTLKMPGSLAGVRMPVEADDSDNAMLLAGIQNRLWPQDA